MYRSVHGSLLEEKWQDLYSFRSSHCSLNANDGIDYHYLAYEAGSVESSAGTESDPALSHWWQDYQRRKADFARRYECWQQEHAESPDWNMCLSCFSQNDGIARRDGRQKETADGQEGTAGGQAPQSHFMFAEFLWDHRQAARHGDLFRSAIAEIDPSLTLIARKHILKPEFWRDDCSDVRDARTSLHYRSSSYTSWAYPAPQNETDKVPPRDVIIQLCIQWKRGIEVTNHILRAAGYAALYRQDPVDAICSDTLMHTTVVDDPMDLLCHTKQAINQFWQEYKAERKKKQADSGGRFSEICLAGDYGLRKVLRAYLDQPENYIRNLFYTRYDVKEHRTALIFSGGRHTTGSARETLGWDTFQCGAPEERYLLANPALRLMVRSLRRQQEGRSADWLAAQRAQGEELGRAATQLAAINTIMSLNDLLSPQEMFDLIVFDEDGNLLHPHKNYVNEKRTSTNSSTACRLLDPHRGLSVRKIELIRYMLAAGQEDELGENLVEGGFWPVNYLHQEESGWEGEMDLTDYILVYAFRCRSALLGERTLANSTRYQEFSMIRLLMAISRELQLMACVHPDSGETFFRTIREYCPYYVSLPRYVSGNKRAVYPIEQTDKCRKNPVPADVYCCGWIADYELAYDRQRE